MSANGQVEVVGPRGERYAEILTPEALDFVGKLHSTFAERRAELLNARQERRQAIADGAELGFRDDTAHVREDMTWRVAPPAPGLVDRRVEITGPTSTKMTVNALNSGAKVWLADFEDANSPTWSNVVEGQLNLVDALERRIDFRTPEGKEYRLKPRDELATIVVRPRGWHLTDKHVLVGGDPVSGGLLDFGLYFFHCAQRQLDLGQGPYFYLPKLESSEEARLWNDVFVLAQELLGIPRGTIRATVLIETITAAFEMEEILHELREHSAGLNAGRWDYIFSVIKNFRTRPGFVLPDRADVKMTVPFMRAYTELLVKTCHRRSAHAIGGMSAFIPSKDETANAKATEQVTEDKQREAADGFDGSWVAHPGLVQIVRDIFDDVLGDQPNQVAKLREDVSVTPAQLLDIAATPGAVTDGGVKANVQVGLAYVESWLRGNGAAAINNLMEDAATAEISRSQIWQWIHEGVTTAEGTKVTREWVTELLDAEVAARTADAAPSNRFADARKLFAEVALAEEYPTFLTIPGYSSYLVDTQARRAFLALR